MKKSIKNRRLKNKFVNLLEGFKYPLGIMIESLGEMFLIIIAVILSLVITKVTDLFNIRENLIPLLILVFITMIVKELGTQIKDSSYLNKSK